MKLIRKVYLKGSYDVSEEFSHPQRQHQEDGWLAIQTSIVDVKWDDETVTVIWLVD